MRGEREGARPEVLVARHRGARVVAGEALREHELLRERQRFAAACESQGRPHARCPRGAAGKRGASRAARRRSLSGLGVHRQRMLPLGVEKWQGTWALPGPLHAKCTAARARGPPAAGAPARPATAAARQPSTQRSEHRRPSFREASRERWIRRRPRSHCHTRTERPASRIARAPPRPTVSRPTLGNNPPGSAPSARTRGTGNPNLDEPSPPPHAPLAPRPPRPRGGCRGASRIARARAHARPRSRADPPACAPASLNRSAALAGGALGAVSPAPGSVDGACAPDADQLPRCARTRRARGRRRGRLAQRLTCRAAPRLLPGGWGELLARQRRSRRGSS